MVISRVAQLEKRKLFLRACAGFYYSSPVRCASTVSGLAYSIRSQRVSLTPYLWDAIPIVFVLRYLYIYYVIL